MVNLFFKSHGRDQTGAAITEFLFSLPVILIFYVGILEVGRLIGQNDYMKVISYNAALYAAGSAQVDRSAQAQTKANTLYDSSSANQINNKQFTVTPNSDATITVSYTADLKDIAPKGFLPISLNFSSDITVPDLTRINDGVADSSLSEGPQNVGTYCPDGTLNLTGCTSGSSGGGSGGSGGGTTPSACSGYYLAFCNNNDPCTADGATIGGNLLTDTGNNAISIVGGANLNIVGAGIKAGGSGGSVGSIGGGGATSETLSPCYTTGTKNSLSIATISE